jgi:hypothetical protein
MKKKSFQKISNSLTRVIVPRGETTQHPSFSGWLTFRKEQPVV